MSGLAPTRGIDPANAASARAAEALHAGFVEALAVDLVHVASPFDGFGDETVVGWEAFGHPPARAPAASLS